ncbi:MAG: helix-turn-helix domain-containing protein [Phycisphaerales bacterium]
MARPKKASDDEVFSAAYRVMSRLGPAELTLADIAAEAGLTAGALVQRFGSKAALLRLLAEQAAVFMRESLRTLAAEHGSPLGAVRAYAACMARMGESPSALAHHLGWLQLDLADPGMHRALEVQARDTRRWLRERLDAAVSAGEVVAGADTASLARSVEVAISGSMLTWAFSREGACAAFVAGNLGAVLGPYLAQRRGARAGQRKRRGVRA